MGITFYCRNMQNDKVVPITLDEELTMNDLGNIFKRLNIVLFTEQIAEIEENTITLHVNM